ncbi:hypothetical protein LCGC14_1179400 [marine sediment metagenome]|uniref:Uncharacterized protein n=1 Tax=marine sediment metagenome TaxID=412755 RepID=A0A0F9LMS0_9ZZZZ
MLLQRVNRTNPEKIFLVAKNSYDTGSLTNGQPAMWDYATDADGVSVTMPTDQTGRAGSLGIAFAGIAAETIASGDYGLLQVYGYHSSVIVRSHTGGLPAIVAGTGLTQKNAVFALESADPAPEAVASLTAVNYQWVGFALAAAAAWTTARIAVFIKAL